ncbi:MAG: thiol:disulfide interchange protein DsbG [Thiobacillaceae bacterium]
MARLVSALAVAFLVVIGANAADAPTPRAARAHPYQTQFGRLEKTDAVREGARGATHVLYVFFDANCLFCRLTWKALQPYEKVGLAVRWVPVAYQQTSSLARAAAIIQATDPVAALRENELGYNTARFNGGIQPMRDVPAELAARLHANTKLMQEFGAPGTPALVWMDSNGQVRVEVGLPRASELPYITGLRPQSTDDPEQKNPTD